MKPAILDLDSKKRKPPISGAERILAERRRQIGKEGWDAEHDDEHTDGSLALAAICYAAPVPIFVENSTGHRRSLRFEDPWPDSWDEEHDKRPQREDGTLLTRVNRVTRIRMLEKAGALIAAEIDRLLRRR